MSCTLPSAGLTGALPLSWAIGTVNLAEYSILVISLHPSHVLLISQTPRVHPQDSLALKEKNVQDLDPKGRYLSCPSQTQAAGPGAG